MIILNDTYIYIYKKFSTQVLPHLLCFYKLSGHHPPTALSAKTVAIMAHNKGLELGADMVLLLVGGEGGGVGVVVMVVFVQK